MLSESKQVYAPTVYLVLYYLFGAYLILLRQGERNPTIPLLRHIVILSMPGAISPPEHPFMIFPSIVGHKQKQMGVEYEARFCKWSHSSSLV